jgi:hypothetical protein
MERHLNADRTGAEIRSTCRLSTDPCAGEQISRAIRRWALHHHSDKSLQDLAKTYNSYIEGWINYYGHFYRTQLRPTLKRIDAYVIRWARRKFKRLKLVPVALCHPAVTSSQQGRA